MWIKFQKTKFKNRKILHFSVTELKYKAEVQVTTKNKKQKEALV